MKNKLKKSKNRRKSLFLKNNVHILNIFRLTLPDLITNPEIRPVETFRIWKNKLNYI